MFRKACSLIIIVSILFGTTPVSNKPLFYLAPFTETVQLSIAYPTLAGIEPKQVEGELKILLFEKLKTFPEGDYNQEALFQVRSDLFEIASKEEVLGAILDYLAEEKMNYGKQTFLFQNFLQIGGEKAFFFFLSGLGLNSSLNGIASFESAFNTIKKDHTILGSCLKPLDLILRGATRTDKEALLTAQLNPETVYLARSYFMSLITEPSFKYSIRHSATSLYLGLFILGETDLNYIEQVVQLAKAKGYEDEINRLFQNGIRSLTSYYLKELITLQQKGEVNLFDFLYSSDSLNTAHIQSLYPDALTQEKMFSLLRQKDRFQVGLNDFILSPLGRSPENEDGRKINDALTQLQKLKTALGDKDYFTLLWKWGLTSTLSALFVINESEVSLQDFAALIPKSLKTDVPEWPFKTEFPDFFYEQTDRFYAQLLKAAFEERGLEWVEKLAPVLVGSPLLLDETSLHKQLTEISRDPNRAAPLFSWLSAVMQLREIPLKDKSWIQAGLSFLLHHPDSRQHSYWIRRMILDTPYSSTYKYLKESRELAHQLDQSARGNKSWGDFYHQLREKVHFYTDSSDPERFARLHDLFSQLSGKSITLKSFEPLQQWFPGMTQLYHRLEENGETSIFYPPSLGTIKLLSESLKNRYEKKKENQDPRMAQALRQNKETALEALFKHRRDLIKKWQTPTGFLRPDFGKYEDNILSLQAIYSEEKLSQFEEDLAFKQAIDQLLESTSTNFTDPNQSISYIASLIEQIELSGLATWRMKQLRMVWKDQDLPLKERKELARMIKAELAKIYDFFNHHFKGKLAALAAQMPKEKLKNRLREIENMNQLEEVVIGDLLAEEPAIRLLEQALVRFGEAPLDETAVGVVSDSKLEISRFYFLDSAQPQNDQISSAEFGTKGANLFALAQQGFPVPPGFVLSRSYRYLGEAPHYRRDVLEEILKLEEAAKQHFSFNFKVLDSEEIRLIEASREQFEVVNTIPLKLSARSGSFVSMPGFLDSILNLTTFEDVLLAIEKVYTSWNDPKAVAFREENHVSETWGTGVIVQKMIDGETSKDSGSGVIQSHDLATQELYVNGDFQFQTAGETLVGGRAMEPLSLRSRRGGKESLELKDPALFVQLRDLSEQLNRFAGGPIEAEITVEDGKPYLLQMRPVSLVVPGPVLDPQLNAELLAMGEGVSGGAVQARFVFERDDARQTLTAVEQLREQMDKTGEENVSILLVSTYVTTYTSIVLFDPRVAGVVTPVSAASAHAASIARQQRKVLVSIPKMSRNNGSLKINGHTFGEGIQGPIVSADGNLPGNSPTSGYVYLGVIPIRSHRPQHAKSRNLLGQLGQDYRRSDWSL